MSQSQSAQSTRKRFVQQAAVAAGGIAAAGVSTSEGAHAGASAPATKTARLRALLQRPGVTVVPEAYSVFTARLAEINGFDAIYVGGNMMAGMHLGIEDWETVLPIHAPFQPTNHEITPCRVKCTWKRRLPVESIVR